MKSDHACGTVQVTPHDIWKGCSDEHLRVLLCMLLARYSTFQRHQIKIGAQQSIGDCSSIVFPRDEEKFQQWYKASAAYHMSLSEYDKETLHNYQARFPVAVNDYLSGKPLMDYFDGLRPQMWKHLRLYPDGEYDDREYARMAVDDLRRIIQAAPKTTTEFFVFRGLKVPYGSYTATGKPYNGFLSTSLDYNFANKFRGKYGPLLCIRVPVSTSCLALTRMAQCEILFLDTVNLQREPYDRVRSPLLEGLNPLYLSVYETNVRDERDEMRDLDRKIVMLKDALQRTQIPRLRMRLSRLLTMYERRAKK